jgi:hypothetical protein
MMIGVAMAAERFGEDGVLLWSFMIERDKSCRSGCLDTGNGRELQGVQWGNNYMALVPLFLWQHLS